MNQYYEVHCGRCRWWGAISQMKKIYKPNPSNPSSIVPELGCPWCLSDQWLEYYEYDDLAELKQASAKCQRAKFELLAALTSLSIAIDRMEK